MRIPPSRLRPGLHVVRRDDRHLQIGLDHPWRVIVPDLPDVQRLLADLAAGRSPAPTTPESHRALRDLVAADLLVDPATTTERTHALVSVEATGPAAADVLRLLRAADCRVAESETDRATVAVLVAEGEPDRASVDAQVRAGRAHLVVSRTPGGFTIGPFVVPGRTACLRCVDAHRGERDPRRAVVVEQLAGRSAGPSDPALLAVATAWAVRDLLSWLDGRVPSTWSASVTIGADLAPARQEWTRHPHCGCSWADDLVG
ncbi:hypothetical protein ABLE68_01820 [Nocardioides sp. CN2-186]|uniref:hypothetical protein n=1 Tax=Nocardioides tweenelious TaxID=3156607 RepID=UPI0032B3EF86